MEQKVGIKETKELLVGVMKMAVLLTNRLSDGFQVEDLSSILAAMAMDPEFREAVAGIKELPAEVKDIDLEEGFELGMLVLKKVPEIIAAAKK